MYLISRTKKNTLLFAFQCRYYHIADRTADDDNRTLRIRFPESIFKRVSYVTDSFPRFNSFFSKLVEPSMPGASLGYDAGRPTCIPYHLIYKTFDSDNNEYRIIVSPREVWPYPGMLHVFAFEISEWHAPDERLPLPFIHHSGASQPHDDASVSILSMHNAVAASNLKLFTFNLNEDFRVSNYNDIDCEVSGVTALLSLYKDIYKFMKNGVIYWPSANSVFVSTEDIDSSSRFMTLNGTRVVNETRGAAFLDAFHAGGGVCCSVRVNHVPLRMPNEPHREVILNGNSWHLKISNDGLRLQQQIDDAVIKSFLLKTTRYMGDNEEQDSPEQQQQQQQQQQAYSLYYFYYTMLRE
jgi:hypothetical protein